MSLSPFAPSFVPIMNNLANLTLQDLFAAAGAMKQKTKNQAQGTAGQTKKKNKQKKKAQGPTVPTTLRNHLARTAVPVSDGTGVRYPYRSVNIWDSSRSFFYHIRLFPYDPTQAQTSGTINSSPNVSVSNDQELARAMNAISTQMALTSIGSPVNPSAVASMQNVNSFLNNLALENLLETDASGAIIVQTGTPVMAQ